MANTVVHSPKFITVTDKRQITLPKALLDTWNVKPGDKLIASFKNNKLEIRRESEDRIRRYKAFQPISMNNGVKVNWSQNVDEIYDT